MTLLKRKRVLAAKIETTIGTAIALSASDAVMNVYNPMIQMDITPDEREGQGGFGYLSSVPGGRTGTATFQTDLGWDGTGLPAWATTFLPACGFVAQSQIYYPETEAPGSNVKTLTIGCYVDGVFKQIYGAAGTFKISLPTGKRAYIDWTFKGIWSTPSDVTIIDPTYTFDNPLRAVGAATTFDGDTLCYEMATVDIGNEITMRECPTTITGFHSAIITNRNPKITVNPEAKLVATRPSYTDFLSMTEAALSITMSSVVGAGDGTFKIDVPKAQIIGIQEGDRNRLVTDEIEFQCNRNGNTEDQEISFSFTDNA